MAKPNHPPKPYSKKEQEYVIRVAGRVPVQVIAAQINRNAQSVMAWASKHHIKLRVPQEILRKHWSEYARGSKTAEA